MNGSLSQFKATVQRNQERNQKKSRRTHRNAIYKTTQNKKMSNDDDYAAESLEKLKENIRLKQDKERKTDIIIYIVLSIIITAFVWILF